MEPLIGKHILELNNLLGDTSLSEKLARWIYRKRISDLNNINDIPKRILHKITSEYELGIYGPKEILIAKDGSFKHLFQNEQGKVFESVLMKTEKRNTLCVSSQSGCRMGCKFCMTGSIGFNGNLSSHDILNQLLSIPNSNDINRIVVMGMGEQIGRASCRERV